jgi:hypothetical protein
VVYGNQMDLRKTKLRKFIENMENNPPVARLFVLACDGACDGILRFSFVTRWQSAIWLGAESNPRHEDSADSTRDPPRYWFLRSRNPWKSRPKLAATQIAADTARAPSLRFPDVFGRQQIGFVVLIY